MTCDSHNWLYKEQYGTFHAAESKIIKEMVVKLSCSQEKSSPSRKRLVVSSKLTIAANNARTFCDPCYRTSACH